LRCATADKRAVFPAETGARERAAGGLSRAVSEVICFERLEIWRWLV